MQIRAIHSALSSTLFSYSTRAQGRASKDPMSRQSPANGCGHHPLNYSIETVDIAEYVCAANAAAEALE
jgi:hypothetical protein